MTEGVFNCLIDEERTMAFAKAIAATVRPGDVVVDMGTGSGVLAMLAARAGAKKVYAIEIDRSNIATLNAVFRANALEDRIVLIHGDVCKVDLPEKVDVIIGEMIATALIEELQVPAMNNMLRFAKRDRTRDARSAQRLPDLPRSGA
jgi:protein arginine N-methyltransferase 7